MLNHKRDFNAEYSISREEFVINPGALKVREEISREDAISFMEKVGEDEKGYTKHYFPKENQLKIFIKGGSSLVIDLTNGEAVYEQVRKRPVISAFNRLHYNPGRWWTVFSDIFALSFVNHYDNGSYFSEGEKGNRGTRRN